MDQDGNNFTVTPADTQGTGQQMNAEGFGLIGGGIITAPAITPDLLHSSDAGIAGLAQGYLMAQQASANFTQ